MVECIGCIGLAPMESVEDPSFIYNGTQGPIPDLIDEIVQNNSVL